VSELAMIAGLSPSQAWASTWGDLEAWAMAGRRRMNAQARLTCMAMAAAFNGGQAWRDFMNATRDD